MREELIDILKLELQNSEISEVIFEGLLAAEQCLDLSFYERPTLDEKSIPELHYLDKKIDRLRNTLTILENRIEDLKSRVLDLDEMQLEHDPYAYTAKVRGIGIKTRRFGNELKSLLSESSADLKQVTRNIPRSYSWTVPYFYHYDEGIKKVESTIRCSDTVAYQVPHISILKSSTADSIEYFSSFRFASKLGHGKSTTAKIIDNKLTVIHSGQTWIS